MSHMDPKNLLAIVYQHPVNIFSDFADGEAYMKFMNCEKPFSILQNSEIFSFAHICILSCDFAGSDN